MKFDNSNSLINFEDLDNFFNICFNKVLNFKNVENNLEFIKNFNSFEQFSTFINLLSNLPTVKQIDELTKSNENLYFFEFLKSIGYFNLLDKEQKYHLFVSACSYDSVDIAMLIFSCEIDLDGVKEFMQNYLAEIGTNTEYVIFRKLWEKKIFNYKLDEIEEFFFQILKTSNLEFIEWFLSLDIIDLSNAKIKNKIGFEILENASTYDDFQVNKLICSYYTNLDSKKG